MSFGKWLKRATKVTPKTWQTVGKVAGAIGAAAAIVGTAGLAAPAIAGAVGAVGGIGSLIGKAASAVGNASQAAHNVGSTIGNLAAGIGAIGNPIPLGINAENSVPDTSALVPQSAPTTGGSSKVLLIAGAAIGALFLLGKKK